MDRWGPSGTPHTSTPCVRAYPALALAPGHQATRNGAIAMRVTTEARSTRPPIVPCRLFTLRKHSLLEACVAWYAHVHDCYRRGSDLSVFFLEYDRGTEPPREHAAKFNAYARASLAAARDD